MRGFLVAVAFVIGAAAVMPHAAPAPVASAGTAISASASDLQNPPRDLNVDINVNRNGGRAWYSSPVWIAIGALALVVLLLVIVLAVRGGGGTTIVRD
jgi:hypothetical protein